ncbi:L-ascorbate metabolism protein UlaG (beta-lactamase superfamily) [Rhodococcus sp. SMB37]|uniref:MBL fold metallo-hydrolase n=1 Tax=Rhodococcus sp. SMB37 TaxID=2512213 RepID=UPI00104F16B8|nr:MBL fold metallo-hydrolase [Rhodococcus sp. SMB37]TCN52727.1 L-ascorbate metabolism protein UlaG (beta-lactamase superfamily) [Rhodococcus sp. SMB37]
MNLGRVASSAAAGVGLAWLARAARGLPTSIGASVSDIRPYAAGSPQYREGRFHNTEPSSALDPEAGGGLVKDLLARGSRGRPTGDVPIAPYVAPVDSGPLAVTWFGHSSVLVEIDGYRVLADPVWSDRVSPSSAIGPMRLHRPPVELAVLPQIDAVIISHDHYDHLDRFTVESLAATQPRTKFLVPVGVGAHLRKWRVPDDRIVELDWDEHAEIDGLKVTCTEARHFSGRGLQRNITLWSSWVLTGPAHSVFFGGDSGYTRRFADLGEKYGPFDLTLLPVGAYDLRWPDIHMNPEEAVRTHLDLGGTERRDSLLVPVHWGTFNLAFHAWSEPIARLLPAAEAGGVATAVPMPGQRVDVSRPRADEPWWVALG